MTQADLRLADDPNIEKHWYDVDNDKTHIHSQENMKNHCHHCPKTSKRTRFKNNKKETLLHTHCFAVGKK